MVTKSVLGSYGIQVDTCLNGKEAVEKCIITSYDMIFLDHMMPGFDGVETLKQIREINNGMYRELPIIALTANTVSDAREMFRTEGFTEFIPKPIERVVLERVLRKTLPEDVIQYNEMPLLSKSVLEESVLEEVPAEETVLEKPVSEEMITSEPVLKEEASVKTADKSSLSFAPLSKIGVNVLMGLDYCCGEEDFYLEMLQMFCDQSREKRAEIVSLYETENWADYTVKVHALKSTSLTIGAKPLAEQAKLLEQAGKKKDIEYIRQEHTTLLRLYDEVCETITGL